MYGALMLYSKVGHAACDLSVGLQVVFMLYSRLYLNGVQPASPLP